MIALSSATAATAAVAMAGKAGEICVIGAGPAGLVAARHLLACGLRPTVFEAANEVGGLWCNYKNNNDNSGGSAGKTWKGMRTNLSCYTCSFSDHPWSLSQLQPNFNNNNDPSTNNNNALSLFYPTNRQVHEYLQSYSRKYLESNQDCSFRLGCQVTKVVPTLSSSGDFPCGFSVEWRQQPQQQENDDDVDDTEATALSAAVTTKNQQHFDGVVVASGFFAQPAWPQGANMDCFRGLHLHSSQYQSPQELLASLASENKDEKLGSKASRAKTVAICGSSFSALEIAADIAKQTTKKECKIVCILSSIPWILPRFIPHPVQGQQGFIPVDLAFYRRAKAGLKPELVLGNDPETNQQKQQFMERLIGRKRQEQVFRDTAGVNDEFLDQQAFIGKKNGSNMPFAACISDDFLDLVYHGRIEIQMGRLVGVEVDENDDHGGGGRSLQIQRPSSPSCTANCDTATTTVLKNVDALISATGYLTHLHKFLDEEQILTHLDYQPDNKFAPLILCDDVYHPKLPGLTFVGMYRGPYFGVMELQARLAAQKLQQHLTKSRDESSSCDDADDPLALEISRQIRNQMPQPQFPRGDVVGRMDALASKLAKCGDTSLAQAPYTRAQLGDLVLPVLYQPDSELAESIVKQVQDKLETFCNSPSHVTPVLMQSMLGSYRFERTLTQLVDGSTQFVSGIIKFSKQTRVGDDGQENDYILYREDGVWQMSKGGPSMDVFREYHYLLNPDNGAMEIFLVEGGKRAHLFLSLLFEPSLQQRRQEQQQQQSKINNNKWTARSDHLCIKDLYDAEFQVELEGMAARCVQMKYKVKGPTKDYESLTILTSD